MHRKFIYLVVAALLLMISALTKPANATTDSITLESDDDWPMYQHDAHHTGRTPATIPNDSPLYLQWAYALGERVEVEAQPVLADGVIYQGVMNGEMHAIDASTGEALWTKKPGGPIPHTAAVYNGYVYFGSLDAKVYALSISDGTTVWQFKTSGPVVSAPTIVDGYLYIGSNDGNLYALNSTTGALLWAFETNGPVVSSPAVTNGRVYFGSEDLVARCVNATNGTLIWSTPLYGAGMHNTHPILSDNGNVVIFTTIKAGGSSYVPLDGYPNASSGADPITTWNNYYQNYPTYRTLYYLNANDGDDLWNPATRRYVPLPIPYWGLLSPILAPDGSAWFPAPAGTNNHMFSLDHDNRLFRVDLATGITTQAAGGAMSEFQLRTDEVGRHIFSGNDYYTTISEDLGVYRPSNGTMRALFSNGDPSGYNFGTHMDPHSPLPSRHLWRYGGAVCMGGVPGASPPIIANNMIYFNSYGWLYAVGPTNHGYDPATSFPSRDARLHELTYPRSNVMTQHAIRTEIEQRVADILALGPSNPPITARWEQADKPMDHHEFTFEVYGFEADLVRVLSEAYPYLPSAQQASLETYLSSLVNATLLNSTRYGSELHCINFSEDGLQVNAMCEDSDNITAYWLASNMNLVAQRIYALWVYADATNDWDAITSNWSLINQQFQKFVDAYDPSLGFCDFAEWRVKRLNIGAQIAMAQAVRDMAHHLGYTDTRNTAQNLLDNLLDTRVALSNFVPHLYDTGEIQPAEIRLRPDGTINNDDIMSNGPYNNELIPYSAAVRDRNTDPSQVNWWDGTTYRIDAGTEFMHYPALSGYFPLSSELINRLRSDLLSKTQYYVKSYEVNNPWWWMTDLAHHTTGSGEHLYSSPSLSWTIFQVKAWILEEDWDALVRQLPEPASFNSRYDLYRLQNLVTLLALGDASSISAEKSVNPLYAEDGDVITYTISLSGYNVTATVTDPLPLNTTYNTGSARVEPEIGDLTTSAQQIHWTGTLSETTQVQITFAVTVNETEPNNIINTVTISDGDESFERTAVVVVNGIKLYLPITLRS